MSGGYSEVQPSISVPPHNAIVFGSRNSSPLTGTNGWIEYSTDDGAMFHCGWSNPFIGDGVAEGRIEGVNAPRYGMRYFCSTGNTNSKRRWVIFPLREVKEQSGWASCKRCKTLFFNGWNDNKGRCSKVTLQDWQNPLRRAGEHHNIQVPHDPSGSFDYVLNHGAPPLGHEEGNWCSCRKCNSLFWNGEAYKGRCPAGGNHEAEGSFDYIVTVNAVPPQAPAQDGWRWCTKCRVLFYSGDPNNLGDCPRGVLVGPNNLNGGYRPHTPHEWAYSVRYKT